MGNVKCDWTMKIGRTRLYFRRDHIAYLTRTEHGITWSCQLINQYACVELCEINKPLRVVKCTISCLRRDSINKLKSNSLKDKKYGVCKYNIITKEITKLKPLNNLQLQ